MDKAYFVAGFDRNIGQIRAASHAEKSIAYRIAADYRRGGRRAKVFLNDEDYFMALDKDYAEFGPCNRTTIL